MFERATATCNDLGLFSEQFDRAGQPAGQLPAGAHPPLAHRGRGGDRARCHCPSSQRKRPGPGHHNRPRAEPQQVVAHDPTVCTPENSQGRPDGSASDRSQPSQKLPCHRPKAATASARASAAAPYSAAPVPGPTTENDTPAAGCACAWLSTRRPYVALSTNRPAASSLPAPARASRWPPGPSTIATALTATIRRTSPGRSGAVSSGSGDSSSSYSAPHPRNTRARCPQHRSGAHSGRHHGDGGEPRDTRETARPRRAVGARRTHRRRGRPPDRAWRRTTAPPPRACRGRRRAASARRSGAARTAPRRKQEQPALEEPVGEHEAADSCEPTFGSSSAIPVSMIPEWAIVE